MERVARIRERLQAEGADVFLISNPVNRRYITGFTGSAGLVWISSTKQAILTDFRYVEQVKAECPGWELIRIETYNDALEELIKGENIRSIVFEEEHVTVKQLREWQDRFAVELKGSSGWVEELRMCKTPAEIEHIRRAAQIGDEAFAELLPNIKSGRTEREIALELEYLMRRKGASAMSFAPIVASGPRVPCPMLGPGNAS